jgi:putative heme-binding domain-containing protein
MPTLERVQQIPRRNGWSWRWSCALAGLALLAYCSGAPSLSAQEKNPYAGDAKVAKLGEYQFRSNCAFCHGLGARGGGRGPDLTRAQKHHGNTDVEIFHNIHDGIAGTAMPAATNGGIGVGMSDAEIWQVITYLRSVEQKATAAETGDAARGKELFYGNDAACGTCHMVNGKGGRLGPDLTTSGASRSVEYLAESVRIPSRRLAVGLAEPLKDFAQEYETATVITADATLYQGVILNEDSFTVQMLDRSERLHSFEKAKLRSFQKSRESLMPAYDAKALPEKDLKDLIAFLLAASSQGGAQ